MAAWLASAAAAIGLTEEATPPSTPKNLSPDAVDAAIAEMERLLDGTDTEALLRAGGEQGLAPVGGGLGRETLCRWLLAEKGCATAAAARLKAHAVWRAEYVSGGNGGGREGAGKNSGGKGAQPKKRHPPQRAAAVRELSTPPQPTTPLSPPPPSPGPQRRHRSSEFCWD